MNPQSYVTKRSGEGVIRTVYGPFNSEAGQHRCVVERATATRKARKVTSTRKVLGVPVTLLFVVIEEAAP